jgi:hypothetical protein
LAIDNVGNAGNCQPNNQYRIYNYYCINPNPTVEFALDVSQPCREVAHQITLDPCHCVEAFIDTITQTPPWSPVFYRCYWYSANPASAFETVAFEWSATSEYIEWYVKTIAAPGAANSVLSLLTGVGVAPPVIGYLVPLLKVTNHSPSLF